MNVKGAKYVASHAIARAVGYGLTGDYKVAESAKKVQDTSKRAIDNARLNHQYNRSQDDLLDAHEQYKQNHTDMTDQ